MVRRSSPPQVRDTMLLVDVRCTQLSVLRVNKIRAVLGEDSFVNLAEKAKPGETITVRIMAFEENKRRGTGGKTVASLSGTYCSLVLLALV